ncbi:Acetylglutamate kinase [Legionella beliardensis]|uniref:Acetylglutamate kinase n=1 Tax=Legionella beliardensis TaxID=91822 RepID=A0A378I1N6_9GAMM|nr:acetylglutamate kinase [Legionella beliardensis]STX28852.1 Acetylglutamate kinase [Legionella beliardensis]
MTFLKFNQANHKLILIKVGGSILQDAAAITALCLDFKEILAHGYQIVLVHGGSKAINEALKVYGIESTFIQGLRVTSKAAINIIEMVLCGQVNQLLIRKLNHVGIKASGLSGAENQLLLCDYLASQYGFVGDIKTVNATHIKQLLANNLLPVIATLGVDKEGQAVNVNGDMAACHLAHALAVDQLIYLTDQDGVYDSQGQLFSELAEEDLKHLIAQSIVTDGMLVKVQAILNSLEQGLRQIRILNGKQQRILTEAILHEKKRGTLCVRTTCQPTLKKCV